MAETVAPEFARFVAAERRAQRLPQAAGPIDEGEVFQGVFVEAGKAGELLRVAARQAAGFFRPTRRAEVVWVDGGSELAVGFAAVDLVVSTGMVRLRVPVRCDQTGAADVGMRFAVGSPRRPAGLYAATARRPDGPEPVVAAWGEALVAFGWQCMLGLVAGIAAATGKDRRGNLLVPVELSATARGLEIVPMARHRFAGSSPLRKTIRQERR